MTGLGSPSCSRAGGGKGGSWGPSVSECPCRSPRVFVAQQPSHLRSLDLLPSVAKENYSTCVPSGGCQVAALCPLPSRPAALSVPRRSALPPAVLCLANMGYTCTPTSTWGGAQPCSWAACSQLPGTPHTGSPHSGSFLTGQGCCPGCPTLLLCMERMSGT